MNRVLVVGCEQVGCQHFVHQLSMLTSSPIIVPSPSSSSSSTSLPTSETGIENTIVKSSLEVKETVSKYFVKKEKVFSYLEPISFNTKYYTANVEVDVLCIPTSSVKDQSLEIGNKYSEMRDELFLDWSQYQAILLVFNFHDHSSYQWIKHIVEDYLQSAQVSFDTSMCVGVLTSMSDSKVEMKCKEEKKQGDTQTESVSENDVRTWCLDQGYEFVRYDLEAKEPSIQATEEEKMNIEIEKVGIERVKEALECTMWPDMSLTQNKRTTKTTELPPPSSSMTLISNHESISLSSDSKTSNTEDLVTTRNEQQNNNNNDKQMASLKPKGLQRNDNKSDSNILEFLSEIANQEGQEEMDEKDKEIENFDKLLGEMLNLKMKGDQMPHEKRKEKAAQLAMSLFQMMNIDEDDEEDEPNAEIDA